MSDKTVNKELKIAVIGGGASGMTAAIFAAKNKAADVTIFERNDFCGKKILSTGNGRANLSNSSLQNLTKENANTYFRGEFLESVNIFNKFSYDDIIEFLKSLGIYTVNKDSYIYPVSNQAIAVKKAFENYICNQNNIHVLTDTKINNLTLENDKIIVHWKKEEFATFDKVILATGGCAFPKSGSDGTGFYLLDKLNIPYTPMKPALVELICDSFSEASGCRCNVKIAAYNDITKVSDDYYGELQINKNSLSGIVVFQVSGIISKLLSKNASSLLMIDFLPSYSKDELIKILETNKIKFINSPAEYILNSLLPEKLIYSFLNKNNLQNKENLSSITEKDIENLANSIKECKAPIDSTGDFEKAQTGTGGISFNDIDSNLRLLKCPNIFVCGELLDIDGICGGYNLSLAFSTGAIAGTEAAND